MVQAITVGARQIKAARAMLDWSQEDLAGAANLSIATIRKLELGHISPRHSTTFVVQQAIENAGLEFIQPNGIRRRPEDILIYQGPDGVAAFFNHVSLTMKNTGGEMVIVAASMAMFAKDGEGEDCGKIVEIKGASNVKCLLTENSGSFPSMAGFEFRSLSKSYVDPAPFCVYGDKYAIMTLAVLSSPRIVVIQSPAIAQASHRHFHSMWDKATPLHAPNRRRLM